MEKSHFHWTNFRGAGQGSFGGGNAGTDHRQLGALLMKIVSQCREQARRVYHGAILEAKKEIPVSTER